MRWSIERWRRWSAVVGAAAVVTIALAARQVLPPLEQRPPSPLPRRVDTMRPEILGTHGIVAAGRHYSVAARTPLMAGGGNAGGAGGGAAVAAAACGS